MNRFSAMYRFRASFGGDQQSALSRYITVKGPKFAKKKAVPLYCFKFKIQYSLEQKNEFQNLAPESKSRFRSSSVVVAGRSAKHPFSAWSSLSYHSRVILC